MEAVLENNWASGGIPRFSLKGQTIQKAQKMTDKVVQNAKSNWITIVLSIIVSNAVTLTAGYLAFKGQVHEVDINAQSQFVQQLMTEIKEHKVELVALRKENEQLRKDQIVTQHEIASLRRKLTEQFDEHKTLLAYFDYMPGPAWMKNKSSEMIYINRKYSEQWNVSMLKYKGQTDHEIWPEEVADAFVKNDKIVLRKGGPIVTHEKVPRNALMEIGKNNPLETWKIWKFPVVLHGEVVGVGGIAIPEKSK